MKLPRDLGGADLAKALSRMDDVVTRQTYSPIRLTCIGPPQQHITIPAHSPLKIGTLAAILDKVAGYKGLSREQLTQRLF